MKVDRLIVLVLHSSMRKDEDGRAEDLRDGYALGAKFQKKHGNAKETSWEEVANGAGFEVAGHEAGQIGKHNAVVVECLDLEPKVSREHMSDFLKGAKTCGMYILMHGQNGLPTPFEQAKTAGSPDQVAALVLSLCPKDFALLKVNIVACTLARKPHDGPGGPKIKKQRDVVTKAGSWAQAFCRALKRTETMVAAYSEAVYVVRENNPEFKTPGVDGAEPPKGTTLGQKAVERGLKGNSDIQAVKAHRTEVKKVFQYGGGMMKSVNPVSLEEYKSHVG